MLVMFYLKNFNNFEVHVNFYGMHSQYRNNFEANFNYLTCYYTEILFIMLSVKILDEVDFKCII